MSLTRFASRSLLIAASSLVLCPRAHATTECATTNDALDPDDNDDESLSDEEAAEESGEAESHEVPAGGAPGESLYSRDLTDAELARRFVDDLPSIGSISVGFADEGRLMNAVQMPSGTAWQVLIPDSAWGTQETIDALVASANAVREQYPGAPGLRINHISKRDGGYLRPHKSHQSGRDVDLGFYYYPEVDPAAAGGDRTKLMDAALNWALLRELVTRADVQMVLVDRRISRFLQDYALSIGEDPAWLQALFRGPAPLIQHARRHKDHFHVRFYAPRSQELGRRVQPLLAKRPDTNLMVYRIRPGDTLGHIARRFGSTVSLIQKANRMTSSFLRVSRTLVVPLRGPCTRCPLPPPVVVPPKRVPPPAGAAAEPQARDTTQGVTTSEWST